MIRSTKHTLKFTNKNKKKSLELFVSQYREMVKKYVNILWNEYLKNPPSLLDNDICQSISTEIKFDSRIRQCAAKQACAMVQAVVNKHNKRLYKLAELQREGKNCKYLQRKVDLFPLTKPKVNKINVELDSRFIDFQEGLTFEFVQITQIGDKRKIRLPIKLTERDKHWLKLGKRKSSIRIEKNNLVLFYEVPNKEKKSSGREVGADQGQLTCLSLSDGQITIKNKDGYDLNIIQDILERRKKGSKGFRRAQEHRKNYINWSLNQLNFNNIKKVKLEKISNIRKGKKVSRKLSHWKYTLIKSKLVMLSEDKGFVLVEQNGMFMSQRCNQCGWTHKSNRKGKTFKCTNTVCGFTTDSDLNAASNHEAELLELPPEVWHKHLNRTIGFFWFKDKVVYGQECIVPDVKEV